VAGTPLDFIEQTGLSTQFPGIKEDFKFPGFDSSPETEKTPTVLTDSFRNHSMFPSSSSYLKCDVSGDFSILSQSCLQRFI
jgi:hypothetical protein